MQLGNGRLSIVSQAVGSTEESTFNMKGRVIDKKVCRALTIRKTQTLKMVVYEVLNESD
jgi:hypothetical protein